MRLRLGIAAAVTVLLVSMSSCSLPFYWQAVTGQVELLRKRVPIDEVLNDPAVPVDLKDSLQRIMEMRAFAVEALHLPDNDSYTTYADLGRPYVVWNVVAAAEFSTLPETWCFPFAGCVSYRGFFSRDKAAAFATKLDAEQMDTYVGGANAYSTLGYFADPVLNTMLVSDGASLAALLFHELAHQKVYVKGDSELSEAFASVIEEYGTRQWLDAHGDSEAFASYQRRAAERVAFGDLVVESQQRLAQIYSSSVPEPTKRELKQQEFATLREAYAVAKRDGRMTARYDAWFEQPLNNAVLASVATYRLWVPALRFRLETLGLERFYDEIGALEKLDADARNARLQEWDQVASAARGATEAG